MFSSAAGVNPIGSADTTVFIFHLTNTDVAIIELTNQFSQLYRLFCQLFFLELPELLLWIRAC
ncbi:MAG: hypothetical protein ACI9W3_001101 [Marinoscillum sp.]